jgi:glycyl-tRNA synthetase (class II)
LQYGKEDIFKNVISHAKEYGFIFPSSEIYDGLSAVYDYAQSRIKKEHTRILVEINGSNER